MTQLYICAAPVVTVWPSLEKIRKVDQPATMNDASMYDWLQQMTTQERRALCFERRVETQILYGEFVEVDEVHGEWAKIRATEQPYRNTTTGYPGWVNIGQLVRPGEVKAIGYVRVKELRTPLIDKEAMTQLIILSLNTILPVVSEQEQFYEVATAHGNAYVFKFAVHFAQTRDSFEKKSAAAVAHEMMKFVDTPYIWGGMSSYGYDCSGLSYNAMKACGYKIPRDANDQACSGQSVDKEHREHWRAGDLLFFTTPPAETVTHVGIYLGNDMLLHSTIYKDKVEVIRLQGHSLNKEISHVRRYIEGEMQ